MGRDPREISKQIFRGLEEVAPDRALRSLLTSWAFGPSAIAVVFTPGREQEVIDFLTRGLAESEYDQEVVSLGDLMKLYPENQQFFKLFFGGEIKTGKISAGQERKKAYIFRDADKLSPEQIVVLKFANDLLERDDEIRELMGRFSIYPIVMQSTSIYQRIPLLTQGASVGILRTENFTKI